MNREDTNIYIKKGRKYKPIGIYLNNKHDYLTEGVWVVHKNTYSSSITNGDYIKELFNIDKMSNLVKMPFAELGGMHKIANEIASRFPKEKTCKNFTEVVHTILRLLKEIQEEK